MKTGLSLFIGALAGAALVGLVALHVPLPLVATVAAGLACLGWLVVIVVLPWNLYFQARHVSFEMERSKKRNLPIDPDQEKETQRITRRMLRISVGLHVVSAGLLSLGAWLSAEPLGFAFAGLFLLSTLFRPGVEYYRYLRARLSDALTETRFPRDDVEKLVAEVRAMTDEVEHHGKAVERLQRELSALSTASRTGDQENQRRLEGVARKFEETIDRLTDNQEIISGIKAFLRLVKQPAALAPTEP